ncbi:unnamed protein product [Eretmochelys imbricata]
MEEPGQGCPEAGGGHRARAEEGAAESQIRKAVEFKAEGNRCYKEKKFREAIGKYHRALLQLKGVQGRAGAASPEQSPPDPGRCPLTEEQLRLVESTEVECYDSLTGCWRNKAATSKPRTERASPPTTSGDYARALLYLKEAKSREPADTNVLRYIQLTELKILRRGQRDGYKELIA